MGGAGAQAAPVVSGEHAHADWWGMQIVQAAAAATASAVTVTQLADRMSCGSKEVRQRVHIAQTAGGLRFGRACTRLDRRHRGAVTATPPTVWTNQFTWHSCHPQAGQGRSQL